MTSKPKPEVFGKPDTLENLLGPIVDVTIDASERDKRELLAEIDRRAAIGRLEREHAIMKQAIRRSQHYLGLVLQPGGISARTASPAY